MGTGGVGVAPEPLQRMVEEQALAAVAATDLVTTVSAALARRFQSALGLVLHAPPFADNRLRMTLVCSHVRAADPFLAWFRTLVREVALTVLPA